MKLTFENGLILRDTETGIQVASLDSATLVQGTPVPATTVGPLLAAAPELLAALGDAMQYMLDYNKCQNNGLLADMQAAINKAKGK